MYMDPRAVAGRIHESERIYGDRLVSMADLKKLPAQNGPFDWLACC